MTDYVIKQVGKLLTSDSAIKIAKYDNKVSRFVFDFDGTIPEDLRLYCAFLNPKTGKYFYSPVIRGEEDSFVIIGTEISYYPSRWDMILIGISPDDNIDVTTQLADDLIVWSSFTFKRITVIDTFISDDAMTVTHPNIEKAMDDLMVLHDEVMEYSSIVGADATEVEANLAENREILAEMHQLYDSMVELDQSMLSFRNDFQATYNSYMSQMESAYRTYMDELRREKEGD